MNAKAPAWLAIECTRDGAIAEVLHDDLGLARGASRFREIFDSGSTEKAEGFLESLREQKCVAGCELNVRAKAGARPLCFAGISSGESLLIVGVTAASRDEYALYEELSRLNNELINRERELARNGAALARLAAEKSRVVAIAAHDLRNPLTVIAAYADLLKMDRSFAAEHKAHIEEIGRSAHFMMELVEEMLDNSRLESGHIDLDPEELDLVNAGRHAATIGRVRAERKEITLVFEPQVERAPIRADPVKLRQILNNLVVNAIKFSPARTTVTIRVRRSDSRCVVEVEDRGIGIAREKLAAIFEPFATLGPAGTAGEKSTGLGLAIVKQLAEMHGATVEVESEEERGSVFRVAFPAIAR